MAGRANTAINGIVGDCFDAAFSHNVDIQMGGGNDFVRLEARPDGPNPDPLNNPAGIRNALIIDTGTGDDTLELLAVSVANETRIITGGGNDIVFIDRVGSIRSDFRGGVTLNTGGNNDFLEIQSTVFRAGVAVTLNRTTRHSYT